jgi:hypothetical protein
MSDDEYRREQYRQAWDLLLQQGWQLRLDPMVGPYFERYAGVHVYARLQLNDYTLGFFLIH